jgi:hypothetical protein
MEHPMNTVFNHITNLRYISPVGLLFYGTPLYQKYLPKSRKFLQIKFFAEKRNRIQNPSASFTFSKINFYFKMFAQTHGFLLLTAKERKDSWQLAVGSWQEDEKVNIIEVFSGMIYPPIFFMFSVFSGPIHVNRVTYHCHGALPQSGLLPALRQHLWARDRNYKQFVGIVFVIIMKNCFISCLDKAVITSSLYRGKGREKGAHIAVFPGNNNISRDLNEKTN